MSIFPRNLSIFGGQIPYNLDPSINISRPIKTLFSKNPHKDGLTFALGVLVTGLPDASNVLFASPVAYHSQTHKSLLMTQPKLLIEKSLRHSEESDPTKNRSMSWTMTATLLNVVVGWRGGAAVCGSSLRVRGKSEAGAPGRSGEWARQPVDSFAEARCWQLSSCS